MKAAKHTPGIWVVTGSEIGRPGKLGDLDYETGEHIAHISSTVTGGPDVCSANASLIGAAPDLLDACENVLAAWSAKIFYQRCNSGITDEMAAIKSAIEKAKGGGE